MNIQLRSSFLKREFSQILKNKIFLNLYQQGKVLLDCIKELSRIMAQAFVMREMEDISSEEICKLLEISQTNLWVRLHRARLQLRRCLEVNWFI